MMGRFDDLKGMKYGRLVVIERVPRSYKTRCTNAVWLCQCECGAMTIVQSDKLKSGAVQSCGCLRSELAKERMREIGRRPKKIDNSSGGNYVIDGRHTGWCPLESDYCSYGEEESIK